MDVHVAVLGPEDTPAILDVFCDAFADYPVMRYVLGPNGHSPSRLRQLIGYFVLRRVRLGGPLFGARAADGTGLTKSAAAGPSINGRDPHRRRHDCTSGHAGRSASAVPASSSRDQADRGCFRYVGQAFRLRSRLRRTTEALAEVVRPGIAGRPEGLPDVLSQSHVYGSGRTPCARCDRCFRAARRPRCR